jgi:peroxin-19
LLSIIQSKLIQFFAAAEVLLPSLKEIVSKYPDWLEENGSKISPEEKERFESQLKLMQEVCAELEKEKADDSPDVKKDRFTIVLDKMQRMQDLGQPPEDLVGAGAESIMPNLGEGALPGGEQCSIM